MTFIALQINQVMWHDPGHTDIVIYRVGNITKKKKVTKMQGRDKSVLYCNVTE